MKKTFYSNGKLLITAEYLVLDGAKALALPTKFGQNLIIEDASNKSFYWTSFDSDKSIWFESQISFQSVIENKSSDTNIEKKLIEILHQAYKIKPDFINNSKGYKVTTELTFPKNWGLGTSSTLINNIAQWLKIDAYQLLKNSFGGSGYDIACAKNNSAIIYQLVNEKPKVIPIDFHSNFTENIFFVYLNRKQNSREAISKYYENKSDRSEAINKIDRITQIISTATDLNVFAIELQKHETILSEVLEMQTIKEAFFNDFNGVIKSLGAWNGDFVMAISKVNPTQYFKDKGFETVVSYDEMIL